MPQTLFIAVDLGGTKIYGALMDAMGHIYAEDRRSSAPDALAALDALIGHLRALAGQQTLAAVGLGAPGITTAEGVIVLSAQLGWQNMPLKKHLEDRFGLPAFVENDANAAALGEYTYGAGRGASSLICIGVGTGVGSGIIIDGHIYRGSRFGAGEVGYLLPGLDSLKNTYAGFGAFEQLASGSGIAERARKLAGRDDVDARAAFEAARRGESWAEQVVEESADLLTWMAATVAAVLDPEVIVLTGGVMESAGQAMAERIAARLPLLVPSSAPRIAVSELGARAAALGALALARQSQPD